VPDGVSKEPSSNQTILESNFSSVFVNSTLEDVQLWEIDYAIPIAPVFLYCCAISLAAISAFLRSGFILKLIAMLVAVIAQVTVLGYSDLFEMYNDANITHG